MSKQKMQRYQLQRVWDTLSAINVNEHTDTKNNFTYLSWSWAWATLQEYYPHSTYKFQPINFLPNGSCEVWVELTVEGVTREMWLAVTDFRNKPVTNPSCDLVANARMRCLVKAIAMFGLGHYIYAGESLPMQETKPVDDDSQKDPKIISKFSEMKTVEDLTKYWNELNELKVARLYVEQKTQTKERLGL
jgi:hypothetical protein